MIVKIIYDLLSVVLALCPGLSKYIILAEIHSTTVLHVHVFGPDNSLL
jgi:hypothetical protein